MEKYATKSKAGSFHLINPGKCPFLSEGLCSVYEARPRACRQFPTECGTVKAALFVTLYKADHNILNIFPPICPGFKKLLTEKAGEIYGTAYPVKMEEE